MTPKNQLEQKAADNHKTLFRLNAEAIGGEENTSEGLTWTYSGPGGEAMVAFPELTTANAGEKLDGMMAYYRANVPKGIGCWSLDPPQPADLGIRLLARGFQPGWRPCWMVLNLANTPMAHPIPQGLDVQADNYTDTSSVKNLPYTGHDGAISPQLMHKGPDIIQRFVAKLDGRIVGHSCVLLAGGSAGIYNVGVIPAERNKGIGKAVVTAACRYAKEQGYPCAVLNATGRRMYEQIGFEWISNGFTWWLTNASVISYPPPARQIALAEAIGQGNIPVLNQLGTRLRSEELNRPLGNRMTLVQLAVHCRQPISAQWLIEHGATYTVLDAWDLGWKERAASLLAAQPGLINQQYGEAETTLLHIAAERNDAALAKFALSARPNLEIRDKLYGGTPLDWAEHAQGREVEQLIRAYMRL